ncbi:MAG: TOBE domain-containing protein, partial [Pseudomonadota bacterium]
RDPKVYLFDEPLSNLDAALRVATRIEIAQLKESMPDSTMVYVTHDQVEAMALASKIVVLANRGIAQVGSPLTLYEAPENEFVAQFIGSPAMNLLPGTIVSAGEQTTVRLAHGGTLDTRIATPADLEGSAVNIGIRPEHVTVTQGAAFAVEARVKIVEALGEVTQVYLDDASDAQPATIAKLAGVHRNLRDTTMRLTAPPEHVHLFQDGQSLRHTAA